MTLKLERDFVIRYSEDDIKDRKLAEAMVQNEMVETTPEEAIDAMNLTPLGAQIHGAKLRMKFNPITAHKFKTEEPWDNEFFDIFLEACQYDGVSRKKLADAKLKGW
jgi:hypothetical protein